MNSADANRPLPHASLTRFGSSQVPAASAVDFSRLNSPVIFEGNAKAAYRDPAAFYHEGTFYLYFTIGTIGHDGLIYWQTAWSKSRNLFDWSAPECFTPKDRIKNFSSPGNVIQDGNEFVLCLQTYPTPGLKDKYGDASSRIWTMRSKDLEHWGDPNLLQVEGPAVPQEKMSRLIDPYLLKDKDNPDKWWCFFKKDGRICYSWSHDLRNWKPEGMAAGGENPCVIVDNDEYVLFYAPRTGIGVKRSHDLKTWCDCGILTFGVSNWDWARGRLSAGFVLDLRKDSRVVKALMFFHGSRWPEEDPRGGWASWVGIGIAWSDDINNWEWPGKI